MTVQPTLLVIADIAGYTRFMKLHSMSLVHAQEIVAQLLEAVIDAAGPDLLVTPPVYEMLDAPLKASARTIPLAREGLGDTDAYYVDLQAYSAAAPPAQAPLAFPARLARHMRLIWRSLPYILRMKKACTEFRNVPQA